MTTSPPGREESDNNDAQASSSEPQQERATQPVPPEPPRQFGSVAAGSSGQPSDMAERSEPVEPGPTSADQNSEIPFGASPNVGSQAYGGAVGGPSTEPGAEPSSSEGGFGPATPATGGLEPMQEPAQSAGSESGAAWPEQDHEHAAPATAGAGPFAGSEGEYAQSEEHPTQALPESEERPTAVMDRSFDESPPPVPPTYVGRRRDDVDADREPRPDRLWPHFIWEILLAVGVGIMAIQLYRHDSNFFEISSDNDLWMVLAGATLFASGFALSLRAGVPNLAMPAISAASIAGLYWLMLKHDFSWGAALPIVIGAAALFGLLVGVLVAFLNVPAWMATIGAAFVAYGLGSFISEKMQDEDTLNIDLPGLRNGILMFVLVALVSIIGGAIWLNRSVRDRWSVRLDRDPAARPAVGAIVASVGALLVSSAAAALAAFFGTLTSTSDIIAPFQLNLFSGSVLNGTSIETWAIAAVLVGGVSIFGRRGGLFGTVLATALLMLFLAWTVVNWNWELTQLYFFVGAAFLAGLLISRLIETTTHRRPSDSVTH